MNRFVAALAFVCITFCSVGAFVIVPNSVTQSLSSRSFAKARASVGRFHKITSPTSPIARFGSGKNSAVDGTGRGLILWALVLGVCVWIFSIPPEYRRAHICTADICVQDRSKCYDCVTADEWKAGIADYYRNGGGISFDFSIADETKEFWSGQ